MGFEGEVETAGGKYLRQREARVFEDPSTRILCVVVPETDDISVRVVPGWLGVGEVVPGRRCEAIEADFMDSGD